MSFSNLTSSLSNTEGGDAPRQPIVVSAFNTPVYAPYRPAVRQMDSGLPRLLSAGENVGDHIPAPSGPVSPQTKEIPNAS